MAQKMNDRMLAIAFGIGRGLQADPTGIMSGAGAAMSGTAESLGAIEARRQSVAESRADRESAMAEQRRIRKESREFQLEDESRRRKERLEDEPTLEEKIKEAEAVEDARQRSRIRAAKELQSAERESRGTAYSITGMPTDVIKRVQGLGLVAPGSAPRAFTQEFTGQFFGSGGQADNSPNAQRIRDIMSGMRG